MGEERKELQESLEKPKGSATLAQWEKHNTEGEVDDEIMRMNREKHMRAEAEKIRKKVEKKNKKKEKKEKKAEKKDKKKKDKKKKKGGKKKKKKKKKKKS